MEVHAHGSSPEGEGQTLFPVNADEGKKTLHVHGSGGEDLGLYQVDGDEGKKTLHVHGSGGEDLGLYQVDADEGKKGLIACIFPECLKTFTRQSDLRRHIDAIHVKKQQFWCSYSTCKRSDEYCGKKKPFARRDKRDGHVRKIHLKGELID